MQVYLQPSVDTTNVRSRASVAGTMQNKKLPMVGNEWVIVWVAVTRLEHSPWHSQHVRNRVWKCGTHGDLERQSRRLRLRWLAPVRAKSRECTRRKVMWPEKRHLKRDRFRFYYVDALLTVVIMSVSFASDTLRR